MPKKTRPHNPKNRAARTVQSAGSVLRRISQQAGAACSVAGVPADAASHIDVVRALLPVALQPHLQACLLKPGELVLFAASAAWAARLRVAACEAADSGAFRQMSVIGDRAKITVRVMAGTAGSRRRAAD
jgi:hypothetical protein